MATENPTGKPAPRLVSRAYSDGRDGAGFGHPYFASRAGPDRIRLLLTDETGGEEIRAVVTESYWVLSTSGERAAAAIAARRGGCLCTDGQSLRRRRGTGGVL